MIAMFLLMQNFGLLTMCILLVLEIGRNHFFQKIVSIFILILMRRQENFWKKFLKRIICMNDLCK